MRRRNSRVFGRCIPAWRSPPPRSCSTRESAGFSFINYDDDVYVFNNAHVLSGLALENLIWAFHGEHWANWHPLTWISHMADCQFFGANPGPPHVVNALLHSANAFLLFFVLLRMTGFLWRSLAVAALFAFHPLHVESVAWIAERKDVLSTFFGFLTLLAYQSYVKQASLRRYALMALFFTLGLISKSMLVTLPCVLLLLDYWPLNRFHSFAGLCRLFGEKLPLFALSAVGCFITFHVQKTGGAVIPLDSLPLVPRLENALLSYFRYLARIFWPDRLAIPYGMTNPDPVAVLMAGTVLVVLTIGMIRFGNRQKYLPVGWFWYVGTFVPVIGIVQVGTQGAADRYTYIPSVGIFLLAVWGLAAVFQRWHVPRSLIAGFAVAVISLCAVLTSRQLGFWRNSETLFKHSLALDPENLETQNCLAWSYATDPELKLRNGPKLSVLPCTVSGFLVAVSGAYLSTRSRGLCGLRPIRIRRARPRRKYSPCRSCRSCLRRPFRIAPAAWSCTDRAKPSTAVRRDIGQNHGRAADWQRFRGHRWVIEFLSSRSGCINRLDSNKMGGQTLEEIYRALEAYV